MVDKLKGASRLILSFLFISLAGLGLLHSGSAKARAGSGDVCEEVGCSGTLEQCYTPPSGDPCMDDDDLLAM